MTNQKAAKIPVLEKNGHRHSISRGRFRVTGFLIFSFGSELKDRNYLERPTLCFDLFAKSEFIFNREAHVEVQFWLK